MQQYFSDYPLRVGEEYYFKPKQAHHAKNVVRLKNEKVRLVHHGTGYFATCYGKGNDFVAMVDSVDDRINEIGVDITLAVAMIRKEKLEFVLQKAAELGVSRIVPFESSRCVAKYKREKGDKILKRYKEILLEASEQCKRNIIPEIVLPVKLSELDKYTSELNFVPYEDAYGKSEFLSAFLKEKKSVTVAIGPEGGFSDEEIGELSNKGFEQVTLGSRILRAETAAIYACSVISERFEML
ncbi:MAG: RsmE family RNA methyltransferase [Hornefia sp.]|nr:RsmE family RNA methyltransferase [Hornefia sp.]